MLKFMQFVTYATSVKCITGETFKFTGSYW